MMLFATRARVGEVKRAALSLGVQRTATFSAATRRRVRVNEVCWLTVFGNKSKTICLDFDQLSS